jgi:hypothetical protein
MLLMIKLRKGTFMACNKRRRVKDGDKEVFKGDEFPFMLARGTSDGLISSIGIRYSMNLPIKDYSPMYISTLAAGQKT